MKKWYTSRTLWTNALAIVAVIFFGKEFTPETVGIALSVINLILRLITKQELEA